MSFMSLNDYKNFISHYDFFDEFDLQWECGKFIISLYTTESKYIMSKLMNDDNLDSFTREIENLIPIGCSLQIDLVFKENC